MRFTLIIPLAPERKAPILESIRKLDYDKNKLHLIVAIGKNPSLNRNKGIDKAEGEFIVFLDDDAFINSDYLNKVDDFFYKNPEIDVVGGPQLSPKDETGFGKISGYCLSSRFGAWKLASRYTANKENLDVDETSLTSANLICRKKVVEKVRFDENLFPGEDPKFISDVKLAGFKVAYSPKIMIYHKRRPTFKLFIKQMFNYGKTRPKKESFFETLKKPFFLIPSLFFIYLLLLVISIFVNPSLTGSVVGLKERRLALSFLWFLPFLIYLLLTIIFTFYDSIKNKDIRAVSILPFLYPTIHLSYGLGMIYGYVRKVF